MKFDEYLLSTEGQRELLTYLEALEPPPNPPPAGSPLVAAGGPHVCGMTAGVVSQEHQAEEPEEALPTDPEASKLCLLVPHRATVLENTLCCEGDRAVGVFATARLLCMGWW